MYIQVYETPLQGNSLIIIPIENSLVTYQGHGTHSTVETLAHQAERIAYHAPSGSVGRRFISRQGIIHSKLLRPTKPIVLLGVDKIPKAGAEGQNPFVYSPILSTLGYNFKTVVNFLDEGKFW